MNMEIERKFKLHAFPQALIDAGELQVIARKKIDQTYLAFSKDQEVRIRRLTNESNGDAEFTHTFKRGQGLSREEVEYAISEEIYLQLLNGLNKRPLEKTRTSVQFGELLVDIDEYPFFDLITAEVEFSNEGDAMSFQVPNWFGPELGNEVEYRNKTLWMSLQETK